MNSPKDPTKGGFKNVRKSIDFKCHKMNYMQNLEPKSNF